MSRPPVEVRRASVEDLDDLLLLWAQSREELSRSLRSLGALPADQLRPRLRDALAAGESTILIARFEGSPAGYAVLRLAPVLAVDTAAVHIDHLYVAPSLRRHGVARGLLLAVTGIAERSGADQVLAGAPPAARDTHRFLARLGFSPLVVRRVVGTAALRRRLSGEGQRRGLEDLLSRRRSLRARAARSGWGGGWGSRPIDPDAEPDPDAGPGKSPDPRTGSIVIADGVLRHLDLGALEADPLPSLALADVAPDAVSTDQLICPDQTAGPDPGPGGDHVPGQGRRRQRA